MGQRVEVDSERKIVGSAELVEAGKAGGI